MQRSAIVFGIDTAVIIGDPAIKRFGHGFHPFTDGYVADAHLAQRAVHVGEHDVKNSLRQISVAGPLAAQSPQHQMFM